MKKHFNEYFAKVVLESCFPQKFDILEISDKPDLRHFVSGTGIEVTYSMPKRKRKPLTYGIGYTTENQKIAKKILNDCLS